MKNILITGASSGIGYGLVNKFLDNNYCVYAVGRSTQLLENINNKNLKIIKADITVESNCNKIYEAINSIELDIISNAGIAKPEAIVNLEANSLREHFEINFFAPIELVTHIVKQNKVNKVLNMSSGLAQMPSYGMFSYCTSKGALHQATKCLELESKATKFTNLRPGMVDTPMQDKLRNSRDTFTDGGIYQQAKESNKLIAPSTVGDFVYWVMQLPNDEFAKEDWSVYDEKHHIHWLKSKSLFA